MFVDVEHHWSELYFHVNVLKIYVLDTKKQYLLDTTAVSSISELGLILDYDLRWSTD